MLAHTRVFSNKSTGAVVWSNISPDIRLSPNLVILKIKLGPHLVSNITSFDLLMSENYSDDVITIAVIIVIRVISLVFQLISFICRFCAPD